MGPAFYVMAILGCGDAEIACQDVRVVETRFESAAACAAATAATLTRNSDIDFPVVMAQCRPESSVMAATGRTPGPRG